MLILCFFYLSLPARADTVITGRVRDKEGQPIEAAMVKLLQADSLVSYTLTSAQGEYRINYADTGVPRLTLRFEHLSYQPLTRIVPNQSQTLYVTLSSKSIALKEVVVQAPLVTLQGDTLSFRLSAFTGQGDVTLKDAMRKIPGIEIAETGKIKYLGKDISHFYIEGMDLLGGKYNIATNNLPATYVNTVQVLNNHQDVKMDKDIFSDQVAINVKLNPKAKLRPIGTYTATTGYGNEWLYQLSGAGMLFKPDFQSILTAKVGNIREFEQEERADLISYNRPDAGTPDILGELTTSTPPLDRDRYIRPDDRSLSLNILHKTREDATLKTNIGYGYSQTTYNFSTLRQYYQEGANIVIEQGQEPQTRTHSPSVDVEYRRNGDTRYLANTFSASASFRKAELPTRSGDATIGQAQRLNEYSLRNDFNLRWKQGKVRWNLTSCLLYAATPSGQLSVTGTSGGSIRQTARNGRFFTQETVSGSYQFRHSRLYFPLTFQASTDRIRTLLLRPDNAEQENRVDGTDGLLAFTPQYEYTHPLRRFVFRGELNLRGEYHNYQNEGSAPARDRYFRFHVKPNLYLNYRMSAQSALTTSLSYRHRTGDVLDMLTAPIQTDYLSYYLRSGVLSESKTLAADLHYDFKIPLAMWFLNADVRYQRTWNNQMSGQGVAQDMITLTRNLLPHHSDQLSASMGITKQLIEIKTKLSLQASYSWSRNVILQNEAVIPYYGQSIGLTPSLNTRPWDCLELDYRGSFARTFSHYLQTRQSYVSQSHQLKLSVFPGKGWEVKLASDITHREITEGSYKTLSLFDAGVHYKFKSFRLGLEVNNLLNQKQYAYTVFNGLDKFSYQYQLRGREVLLSFLFTQ